jgi:hypothetical protein
MMPERLETLVPVVGQGRQELLRNLHGRRVQPVAHAPATWLEPEANGDDPCPRRMRYDRLHM